MNQMLTPALLDRIEASIPPGRPVYMLNLLRYRAEAKYQPGFDATPCSGRAAFHERYSPAFRRLAEGLPIKRLFAGAALAALVAPEGERWDSAAINEYGDFAAFRAVVDTEIYRREVQPHRVAALEDFRLLALGDFG